MLHNSIKGQKSEVRGQSGFSQVLIVILALSILGLITILAIQNGVGQNPFKKPESGEGVGPQAPTDSQIEALNLQSSSDEIEAIEKDINNTNLDDLDDEVDQVNQDLNSI